MWFSGVLGFLESSDYPPPRWKGFSIYTGCACFDKAAKFSSV